MQEFIRLIFRLLVFKNLIFLTYAIKPWCPDLLPEETIESGRTEEKVMEDYAKHQEQNMPVSGIQSELQKVLDQTYQYENGHL